MAQRVFVRRLFIFFGLLIIFGSLVGIVATIKPRSLQPFRFLGRNAPVLADDRNTSSERTIDRYYAFRGNFDEVNARVNAELTPQGFKLVSDDFSFGPRATQYERSVDAESGFGDLVIVYKDMHYQLPQHGGPHSVVGYDDPGWVSLQVRLNEPQTWLGEIVFKARERLRFEP